MILSAKGVMGPKGGCEKERRSEVTSEKISAKTRINKTNTQERERVLRTLLD